MKILLLSSPIVQPDFDRIARLPNLGLASLAAHVDDLCTVHVADIHGMKNHRDYVRRIVNGYDLVGLTAMSFQYQESLELAKIAKECRRRDCFWRLSSNAGLSGDCGIAGCKAYRLHSQGRGRGHIPRAGAGKAGRERSREMCWVSHTMRETK